VAKGWAVEVKTNGGWLRRAGKYKTRTTAEDAVASLKKAAPTEDMRVVWIGDQPKPHAMEEETYETS
jgi:uncharacterized protein YegP (UPF0339 family)